MADIKYYDVILKPVLTEKSMAGMGEKKYTFQVHTTRERMSISSVKRIWSFITYLLEFLK